MMETTLIRIKISDAKRITGSCKEILLEEHPELKGMRITHSHMVTQLVKFFEDHYG